MSRCKYRTKECLGQTEIITQDTVRTNDVNKVVKVDDGCYFERELEQWLQENPTLPHNRQPFTNTQLNTCKLQSAHHGHVAQMSIPDRERDRRNIRKRLGVIMRNIDALVDRGYSYSYFTHDIVTKLAKLCAPELQGFCYRRIREYIDDKFRIPHQHRQTNPHSPYHHSPHHHYPHGPTSPFVNSLDPITTPFISNIARLDEVLKILQQNDAFSCSGGHQCNHTSEQVIFIHYYNTLQLIKSNIDLLIDDKVIVQKLKEDKYMKSFVKKMASMCPEHKVNACKHYIKNYIKFLLDDSSDMSDESDKSDS